MIFTVTGKMNILFHRNRKNKTAYLFTAPHCPYPVLWRRSGRGGSATAKLTDSHWGSANRTDIKQKLF